MDARVEKADVLAKLVALVLATSATEFEVEYKCGHEQVVAFQGALGIGVAAFRSDSKDGRELRHQLYVSRRKRRKIIHAGVEYALSVETFDSFGEMAFRGTLTRTALRAAAKKRSRDRSPGGE